MPLALINLLISLNFSYRYSRPWLNCAFFAERPTRRRGYFPMRYKVTYILYNEDYCVLNKPCDTGRWQWRSEQAKKYLSSFFNHFLYSLPFISVLFTSSTHRYYLTKRYFKSLYSQLTLLSCFIVIPKAFTAGNHWLKNLALTWTTSIGQSFKTTLISSILNRPTFLFLIQSYPLQRTLVCFRSFLALSSW